MDKASRDANEVQSGQAKKWKYRLREFNPALAPALSREAYENACDLQGSAEAVAKDGKHGIACALLVHCLEEVGKSLAMRISSDLENALGGEEPSEPGTRTERVSSTTVFDDHGVKKFLTFSLVPALAFLRTARSAGLPPPTDRTKEVMAFMQYFQAVVERGDGTVPSDPTHPQHQVLGGVFLTLMGQAVDASERFERLRQDGFHVGVRDGKVSSPCRIGPSQFLALDAYAKVAILEAREVVEQGLPPPIMDLIVKWVRRNATVTHTVYDDAGRVVSRTTTVGMDDDDRAGDRTVR